MNRKTRKLQYRTVPSKAIFRCRCGGWVIRDRAASAMPGFRADQCDSCNRIQ